MTQQHDTDLLVDYVEGLLTPEQSAEFEKLMAQDPRLRKLAGELLGDRKQLRQLPVEKAPAQIMQRVNQQLVGGAKLSLSPSSSPQASQVDPPESGQGLRIGRFLSYTGLAALVVLGIGVILRTLTDPVAKSVPVTPAAPQQAGGTGGTGTKEDKDQQRGKSVGTLANNMGKASGSPEIPGHAHKRAVSEFPAAKKPVGPPQPILKPEDMDKLPGMSALAKILAHPVRVGSPYPSSMALPEFAAALPEIESLVAPKSADGKTITVVERPDLRIVLSCAEVRAGEEAVRAWAKTNEVQIIDAPSGAASKDRSTSGRQLTLVMEAQQVQDLVYHLNSLSGEQASITPTTSDSTQLAEQLRMEPPTSYGKSPDALLPDQADQERTKQTAAANSLDARWAMAGKDGTSATGASGASGTPSTPAAATPPGGLGGMAMRSQSARDTGAAGGGSTRSASAAANDKAGSQAESAMAMKAAKDDSSAPSATPESSIGRLQSPAAPAGAKATTAPPRVQTDAELQAFIAAHRGGNSPLTLDLSLTNITDQGLKGLGDLKQLKELYLSGTSIGDAGLGELKGLTDLKKLDLRGTKIGDAGLNELKGLKKLQQLWLSNTHVTGAGVRAIKQAAPDADVDVLFSALSPGDEPQEKDLKDAVAASKGTTINSPYARIAIPVTIIPAQAATTNP